jgi:hypothetical protein
MSLADYLIKVPGDEKRAAIELQDTAKLEQDFGRMAYGFLRDRAAPMLKYLVGFEIVEKDDDGSRAAGIFGLSVNGDLYYVPVFFVSGQIKGMDLLYSTKSRQFVPLRETWISHLLRKSSVVLGQTAGKDSAKDMSSPDFAFLRSPPSGGASGASGNPYKTASDMTDSVSDSLANDHEFQRMLAGALAKTAGCRASDAWDDDAGAITSYVANHCGRYGALSLARSLSKSEFMKSAAVFYDPRDLLVDVHIPPAPESKLEMVTDARMLKGASSDPKRFLKYGFDYVDRRSADEKSESLEMDGVKVMANPDGEGVYSILLTGGRRNKLVVARPSIGAAPFRAVIVIDPSTKEWFTAEAASVFTLQASGESPKPVEDTLWAKASGLSELSINGKYVLVSDGGRVSLPFEVQMRVGEAGVSKASVRWLSDIQYKESKGRALDDLSEYISRDGELVMSPTRGNIRRVGSSLIVPTENWKAFKLSDTCHCTECSCCSEDKFQPASAAEALDALYRDGRMAEVGVDSPDGNEFSVRVNDKRENSGASYKTAMVFLVERMGMDVNDADVMLKEAAGNYKSVRLLKLSASHMGQPGSQAYGYDDASGLPVEEPQVEQVQGGSGAQPPPPERRPGDPSTFGGEGQTQSQQGGQIPQDATQLAGMAADTGQKTVFDHAVIGGLARTYDVNYAIDSFLPEMMKTLDRIGRLLFLFYWKNDEFAERYGSTDMSDLEDQLRSVFKNYGDLVLQLQRKSVATDDVPAYAEG